MIQSNNSATTFIDPKQGPNLRANHEGITLWVDEAPPLRLTWPKIREWMEKYDKKGNL